MLLNYYPYNIPLHYQIIHYNYLTLPCDKLNIIYIRHISYKLIHIIFISTYNAILLYILIDIKYLTFPYDKLNIINI